MKDKRGPLEYGFLSAKVVGHSEPTYEDQKKINRLFFQDRNIHSRGIRDESSRT